MEGLLIVAGTLWLAGHLLYRAGKRVGSRKGFGVGRARSGRRRRR